MIDAKRVAKERSKINKLVADRLASSNGKDEKQIRHEINKEIRAEKKNKKQGKNKEAIAKIRKDVELQMGNSEPKALEKAISKAIGKYYSQQKKLKAPSIDKKCDKILQTLVSEKWCPSSGRWFDKECKRVFGELQLLGAMMDINILKNPSPMEQIFPEVCKDYFDLLAKKRFKAIKVVDEKKGDNPEIKKSKPKAKSATTKKVQEKLASSGGSKTEMEVVREVVSEIKEAEKNKIMKNLRKVWKPAKKPWFDKDCKDAYKSLVEKGKSANLNLGEVAQDYKKFKLKFKSETKAYFKLLTEKKEAFDKEDKRKNDE